MNRTVFSLKLSVHKLYTHVVLTVVFVSLNSLSVGSPLTCFDASKYGECDHVTKHMFTCTCT